MSEKIMSDKVGIETIKEWGKKFQEVSQGFLMVNHFVPASLYAFNKDGIPSHVEVNNEDDNEEDLTVINDLMKEMANLAEAFVVVLDAHAVEKSKEESLNMLASEPVKEDPDSYKALVAVAITKDSIAINQLMYSEKDGSYSFFYNNWEKVNALPLGLLDIPW